MLCGTAGSTLSNLQLCTFIITKNSCCFNIAAILNTTPTKIKLFPRATKTLKQDLCKTIKQINNYADDTMKTLIAAAIKTQI